MRLKLQRLGGAGVAALLLASLGCGGSSVYPVKGKITFEGKPMVGGGSIMFVPLGNQEGKTAGGEIAEDGTYQMSTNYPGDGSMVGEFRVMITQSTGKEPEPTEDGTAPPKGGVEMIPKKDRIPNVYNTHQSPLRAKVEAKSLNEINFELKRSDQPQQGPRPGEA